MHQSERNNMREIQAEEIVEKVAQMCIEANCFLNDDIKNALNEGMIKEESPTGKRVLKSLIENAEIAKEKVMPICQDTGMAVFFVEVGNEVLVLKKTLTDAINEGVRKGYIEGYLRKSVVDDPLMRVNTKDNTPAVIHYDFVLGDKIKITFAPKGFGSENKGGLKMLNPSDGVEGVIDFVVETVKKAGSNPCPPMVIGVGIGGTMDKACVLAKYALTRDVDSENPNPYYSDLEKKLLKKINMLGIGPQGLGGTVTALGVNIETFPTHIAGLPVAVNINCHVARHRTIEI